ncbi:MAG: hypothetical protein WCK77_24275 [Verrucomicrobiota bacterium]
MLTFYPPADGEEFMSLNLAIRLRARTLYDIAERVASAKEKMPVYAAAAEEMGEHLNTLYRPINAFLKSGDWRALVNRRLQADLWVRKSAEAALPHDFIEFWKQLMENNQRAAKPAYDFLLLRLADWRRGDIHSAIPGYAAPPRNAAGRNHPPGWSIKTLLRNGSSDVELAAARLGRTAARKLTPAVLTTRKTGYPLQELQFDDMWHDFEVIHQNKLCRILEFNAVDWYSNYPFNPGLKPRVNIDGVNKSLSERDFRVWAVTLAATVGWSPRGTRFQGERGTAAFRCGLADKLRHWSGGLITVAEPGMSGTAALIGGFAERAKGNPNAKAIKEGLGKLIHNRLAGLPGQQGIDYAHKPASFAGRNKESLGLLELQGLIQGGENLQLSHLTFAQGVAAILQAYDIIRDRHDHDIEGWLEENLITQDFLADPLRDIWVPLADLDEVNRNALVIISRHNPDLIRTRRMSPREVIAPHLGGTLKLSHEAEADCLFDDCKRAETVTAGLIAFKDADMGTGTFRYKAAYQGRDGFKRHLANGEPLLVVVNPFIPERAFLFNPKGQYLGVSPRDHEVLRGDVDALHRKIGECAADFKTAKQAADFRHGLVREASLTHNTRALLDSLAPGAASRHPATPLIDMSDEYAATEFNPLLDAEFVSSADDAPDFDYEATAADYDTSVLLDH